MDNYCCYLDPQTIVVSNGEFKNTLTLFVFNEKDFNHEDNEEEIDYVKLKIKENEFCTETEFGSIDIDRNGGREKLVTLGYEKKDGYLISEDIEFYKRYIKLSFLNLISHANTGTTNIIITIGANSTTIDKEFTITKEAVRSIRKFYAESGSISCDDKVTLHWEAQNIQELFLQVDDGIPIDVVGKSTYTCNVVKPTTFKLTANNGETRTVSVSANLYVKQFKQADNKLYWDILGAKLLKIQNKSITEPRGEITIERTGNAVHLSAIHDARDSMESDLYIPTSEESTFVKHFEKIIFKKGEHRFICIKWKIVGAFWERIVYKDRERLREMGAIYDSSLMDPVTRREMEEKDDISSWEQTFDEEVYVDITLEYKTTKSSAVHYITLLGSEVAE